MRNEGREPDLPVIDYAEHLVEYMFEVSPAGANGESCEYREIAAWAELTNTYLTPWEASALHHLCKTYMSQYYASKKYDCPAPYVNSLLDAETRKKVSDKFDRILSGMKKTRS